MMKFLSKPESTTLIQNMSSEGSRDLRHMVSFWHEHQRWRSFCLASEMVNWLGGYEECIALVLDWGIWPSSEDNELYFLVRSGCGDTVTLNEKPGHWFSGEDRRLLVTFINMFIQFGWGVKIHSRTGSDIVELYLSHDGNADVRSAHRLLHVERRLKELNIDYKVTEGNAK